MSDVAVLLVVSILSRFYKPHLHKFFAPSAKRLYINKMQPLQVYENHKFAVGELYLEWTYAPPAILPLFAVLSPLLHSTLTHRFNMRSRQKQTGLKANQFAESSMYLTIWIFHLIKIIFGAIIMLPLCSKASLMFHQPTVSIRYCVIGRTTSSLESKLIMI